MNPENGRQLFVDLDAERSARRESEYLFKQMKRRRFEGRPIKLGGATGRTQIELYSQLLGLAGDRGFDLTDVEIYFLDEYFGAAPLYYAYARQHLHVGKPMGFRAQNVWVPRGCFFDPDGKIVNSDRLEEIFHETEGEWERRTERGEDGHPPEIHIAEHATHPVLEEIRRSNRWFDQRVRQQGKGRIALLGLGTDGHIGFVERGAATADSGVMLIRLSSSTRRANCADFSLINDDGNAVELEHSRYAITQGIASILSAGELLLAAHGRSKRPAVRRMLLDEPGPQNPSAFVKQHPRVRVFLDVESFGDLRVRELEERGFQVELPPTKKVPAYR